MTIAEEIMNYQARRQVYMPRIKQWADIDKLDDAVNLLLCKVGGTFVEVADAGATHHLGRQPTVAELEAYMGSMWSSRKAWGSAAGPGGREQMAGGSVPAGDTLTPVDPMHGDGVDSERGAEAAAAGIMEVDDAGREGSTRGAAAAGIMEVDDAGREGSARGLREAAAAGIVEVDDAGRGGSALQECPRTPPPRGAGAPCPRRSQRSPKRPKSGLP